MQFESPREEGAQLGLAPLLDVVLLLLIFFVVTTSFTEPRLSLELPDAETADVGKRESLVISLARDGALHLGAVPTTRRALRDALTAAQREGRALEVRADEATPHGRVVELLDDARQAGIRAIAITATSAAGER